MTRRVNRFVETPRYYFLPRRGYPLHAHQSINDF